MANTYELISSYAATGSVSSIAFTSIPATFKDLNLVLSLRYSLNDTSSVNVSFNDTTSGYSGVAVRGGGSGSPIGFTISTNNIGGNSTGSTGAQTVDTFASSSLYIPNYASAKYKSVSVDFTQESNFAAAFMGFYGALWANNAAITSITITPDSGTNWLIHSTAYLYGIKNS
jgi:hypothetical protein